MAWCCLTCDYGRSARKISRLRPSGGAKRYQNSAAFLYFYAPHHHFAFLIQAKLSNVIKGQPVPRARPGPFSKSRHDFHAGFLFFN